MCITNREHCLLFKALMAARLKADHLKAYSVSITVVPGRDVGSYHVILEADMNMTMPHPPPPPKASQRRCLQHLPTQ